MSIIIQSNKAKVSAGSTINWDVSKTGYLAQSGTESNLQASKTISVTLSQIMITYTINPTPADATVTLTAGGYTQVGNSITVSYGTSLIWEVAKTGYITEYGSTTVIGNNGDVITKSIILTEEIIE